MGLIKGCVMVVIALFTILVIGVLVTSAVAYQMLYPEPYISSLREAEAFEYIEEEIEVVPNAGFIKVPEGGIEVLVERLLGNFLSYLRSDTSELDLRVEIDREELRGFFLERLQNVRECNSGEVVNYDDLENICKPSGVTHEQLLDLIIAANNLSFFANDDVDLAGVYGVGEGSEGREKLDALRNYVSYLKISAFYLAIMILILLTMMLVLEYENMRAFLRWAGAPFLIAGLAIMAAVAYGISELNANLGRINYPIIPDVAISLAEVISSKILLYGAISFGIGAVLIACSFFVDNLVFTDKNK